MTKKKKEDPSARCEVVSRADLAALAPLLDGRPKYGETVVGKVGDRRCRAVCLACGGTDRRMMIAKEKHGPDCEYVAFYRAHSQLLKLLKAAGIPRWDH